MSLRMAVTGAVLLLIAFVGIQRGLWTPDEPREAEISREMLLSPTVIPTLNGQQFIEKPPLYYWVVAGAYRVAGAASPAAARFVSMLAGALTLLLVFLWGRRAHSPNAGLLAVIMLCSSVQFLISTHWVLIDPLLMLFTTAAFWAAWELLSGADRAGLRVVLYLALALALWTKGLIGPVLVCAGLSAYVLVQQRTAWRALRPVSGVLALAAALGILVLAMWRQGGSQALYEWAWVNHVQRLLNPGITGHRQPVLYYCWVLPYAALPWLIPLISAIRQLHWRDARTDHSLSRYCFILCAAMFVVLSISATKREIYLLPLLPLLFLWLGIHAADWWRQRGDLGTIRLGALWWWQVSLLGLFLLAAPVTALAWLRRVDLPSLLWLGVGVVLCAALFLESARGRLERAGMLLLWGALALPLSILTLAPHLLNDIKDMAPFIATIGQRLPHGAPVYAASADETLEAIVPFTTGRSLIIADPATLPPPEWLLVQDNHDGRARTPPHYALEISRSFGPGRTLQLWHRRTAGMIGG